MNYDRDHCRLLILQALDKASGQQLHQESLLTMLDKNGYTLSRAQLHIELAWLEENAEAIVDRDTDGVHIALLTVTGEELARGQATLKGVRRPSRAS